jgi:hypothetical protein
MLMQDQHPIAYISKTLGPKLQDLSTYEKEYVAVLLVVEQWRSYLQLGEFTIVTYHKSLLHPNEQRLNTPWQQKIFTKLLGLTYIILYKKGQDNRVADALSRRPEVAATCNAVSVCKSKWLDQVIQSYETDVYAHDMISMLMIDDKVVPRFSLKDGLLRYQNRIWVGSDLALQQKIISAFHDSPVGGHSGMPVTYRKMNQYVAWKGMKSVVQQFVHNCLICQQAKPDRSKTPGFLQPLSVPEAAWQHISMDFVDGLPQSGSANCILVVVDHFTKYSHFFGIEAPLHSTIYCQVIPKSGVQASWVASLNCL